MPPQISDLKTHSFEDLAHELRQPLGTIEALAYFLELTAEDESICGHLQRIQAMVVQANDILERSCGIRTEQT